VTTTVTIDRRFCGPASSGHGGYSSGMLARLVDGPATVTLRLPPPLARPLVVETTAHGRLELRDGPGDGAPVVAVAERRAPLDVAVPEPVSPAQAEACEAGFVWRDGHPFPTCFACGTGRAPGDGWRIFAGPTDDGRRVAARAVCPPDLVDPDGLVPFEQVWAALDCVTSHPLPLTGAALRPPWVLGRYAVDAVAAVPASDDLVVMAWPGDLDGRKFRSHGALYAGGRPVAVAEATWVQLREAPAAG
jgi:hypothetical protein